MMIYMDYMLLDFTNLVTSLAGLRVLALVAVLEALLGSLTAVLGAPLTDIRSTELVNRLHHVRDQEKDLQ